MSENLFFGGTNTNSVFFAFDQIDFVQTSHGWMQRETKTLFHLAYHKINVFFFFLLKWLPYGWNCI